jgi:hypothetical protein
MITQDEASAQVKVTVMPLGPRGLNGQVDIQYRCPYFEGAWDRIQDELSLSAEGLIVRQYDVSDNHIIRELPVYLTPIGWRAADADDPEWRLTENGKRYALWSWAASTGLATWMREEIATAKSQLPELSARDQRATCVALGAACADLALDNGGCDSNYFAGEAIVFLRPHISADDNTFQAYSGLSVATQVPLRSRLARCYELLGRRREAKSLYRFNIRSGLRMRRYSGDVHHRREIQRLVGADAVRLVRCSTHDDGGEAQGPKARALFEHLELTRCRALVDRLIDAESELSGASVSARRELRSYADAAARDASYVQLTLIQSQGDSSGYWLAAHGDEEGVLLTRHSWDLPLQLYEGLSAWDSKYAAAAAGVDEGRLRLMLIAAKWCADFVSKQIAARCRNHRRQILISPNSYLNAFPWSFSSVMFSQLWDELDAEGNPWQPTITCAFSHVTASLADKGNSKPAAIAAFLDPSGDLVDARRAEGWLNELFPSALREVYKGYTASGYVFRQSLETKDFIIFFGHGNKVPYSDDIELLFSLNKLSPNAIGSVNTALHHTKRVALILCCWGATVSPTESVSSWEVGGMPYELRSIGFDCVIAPLWPISTRCALVFLENFLSEYSRSADVEAAFTAGYGTLISEFGLDAVAVEAGCLQIYM